MQKHLLLNLPGRTLCAESKCGILTPMPICGSSLHGDLHICGRPSGRLLLIYSLPEPIEKMMFSTCECGWLDACIVCYVCAAIAGGILALHICIRVRKRFFPSLFVFVAMRTPSERSGGDASDYRELVDSGPPPDVVVVDDYHSYFDVGDAQSLDGRPATDGEANLDLIGTTALVAEVGSTRNSCSLTIQTSHCPVCVPKRLPLFALSNPRRVTFGLSNVVNVTKQHQNNSPHQWKRKEARP